MRNGVFGLLSAGYGEEVAVYRSSSAAGGVWVSIKQRNPDPEAKGLDGEPAHKIGEAAAHLTPAQAVVLRAALDNFLAEYNEE